MKTLSVYIHIPFCVHKCNYCDFLSAPATKTARTQYMKALKKEIMQESMQYKEYSVNTVFFGGGTPSILEGEEVAECMEVLRQYYHVSNDAEITLEMNPGTADKTKLEILKGAGVNRLSIGLQSANDEELKLLGRIHTYKDFCRIYADAREVGFCNINVDLMSALPGQRLLDWERTLMSVLALSPEHISAYSLIVEEGTPLYRDLAKYPPLPDEEEDREMYRRTKEILKEFGYERYEISNYAQSNYACRHNIIYWTRGNYAGFGLGASSMVENVRWKNTDDMQKYLENVGSTVGVREKVQKLGRQECMEEFMYLGLRMMKGVSEYEFRQLYQQSIDEIYGKVLSKWEKSGFLYRQNGYVRLTDKGIDVSNVIMTDFLLD